MCVNLPKDAQLPSSWLCPGCKAKVPRKNDNSTPVRGVAATYALDESPSSEPGADATQLDSTVLGDKVHDPECGALNVSAGSGDTEMGLSRELLQFREEMRRTREEFQIFRQEVAEVREQIASCNARLGKLEARVDEMERRESGGAGSGDVGQVVGVLEATIAQLRQDLDDRDQELLLNDIEISGLPEESGENVTHLVSACAAKLGVTVDERDIVSCVRVGGWSPRAGSEGEPRPRNIAVRLARRAARDQFLRAARVRRTITSEGMGLRSEPRRLYVNERLTRSNRVLFGRARSLARQFNWQYVWTRDGKIFARRCQGEHVKRIRCDKDLDSVFGVEQFRPSENIIEQ